MAVVWRHKNKLLLLAALLGGKIASFYPVHLMRGVFFWLFLFFLGGYVGMKYIKNKLQQFQDKEMTIQLESIRLGHVI